MSKPEQVLIINPQSELKFQGPFTKMVSAFIDLHNPTDKTVHFKIKTTAPKKYCVRPNAGVLLPNEKAQIHVCLQPFDYDPKEKCKHKFMVQSLIDPGDPEFAWKDVKPEKLMDTKLRCLFEYPDDSNDSTKPISPARAANLSAAKKEDRKSIGDYSHPILEADYLNVLNPTNADAELSDVSKEIKQLKEDESGLRQENLKLKELVMHLDRKLSSQDSQSSRSVTQGSPLSNQTSLIVLAMLSGLLGIILGKFLL